MFENCFSQIGIPKTGPNILLVLNVYYANADLQNIKSKRMTDSFDLSIGMEPFLKNVLCRIYLFVLTYLIFPYYVDTVKDKQRIQKV